MKKEKNTNNMENFDKSYLTKLKNEHSNKLGLNVPEGFFENSKESILNSVKKENKKSKVISFSKFKYLVPVAAAVALVISLTFFNNNANPIIDKTEEFVLDTLNKLEDENLATISKNLETDVSLAALFVADENLNEFIDSYVLEDTIDKELMLN